MFSDNVHGGKKAALKAAISFRDATLFSLGQQELLSRNGHRQQSKLWQANNASGVIGVHCYRDIRRGREREDWVASGMRSGEAWRRSFSVALYGDCAVFLMACRERYERHGELSIVGYLKDLPCRPTVPFKIRRRKAALRAL